MSSAMEGDLPPGKLLLSRAKGQVIALFGPDGKQLAELSIEEFQRFNGRRYVKVGVRCPNEITILRGELCQ